MVSIRNPTIFFYNPNFISSFDPHWCCSSNIDIVLEMSLFGTIKILYESTLSVESVNMFELILIQAQDLCLMWVRL